MAEKERFTRLKPGEVARLDPFSIRKSPVSEELVELLEGEGREQILSPEWAENLISRERQFLKEFFGQEINVPPLPEEITQEKLLYWQELQMKLHYLPPIQMARYRNFPGWKVRPEDKFYQATYPLAEGKLPLVSKYLPGKWALVDSRDKPDYGLHGVLYPDDFLAPILEKLSTYSGLKKAGKFSLHSRNVTWNEYHQVLLGEIAPLLEVRDDQVRLPRMIEFNFLGNAYYPQWGETFTWEWLEDQCFWGNKDPTGACGGSASLGTFDSRETTSVFSEVGFRPLVEF